MQFPSVSGYNLLRQKINLPEGFKGQINLVFIPFWQWQQMEVDSWIPFASDVEREIPGVCYYELPTIQSMNSLSRKFINEGMRAGIPNAKTRERTITLYLDKRSFRKALELHSEDHIYVILVDQIGNILWKENGIFQPEKGEAILQALRQAVLQV
jgi:hypothetical protein